MSTTASTGPRPPREAPPHPYRTRLADAEGCLYGTDGTAVTLKGRHVTTTELDIAADDCESGL